MNNTTTERKTAEDLLKQMKEVITLVECEWGVEVVGFTTDAAGDARKARQLLVNLPQYSHIVVLDCSAHQVSHRNISQFRK